MRTQAPRGSYSISAGAYQQPPFVFVQTRRTDTLQIRLPGAWGSKRLPMEGLWLTVEKLLAKSR
jgi:hypothetical protein